MLVDNINKIWASIGAAGTIIIIVCLLNSDHSTYNLNVLLWLHLSTLLLHQFEEYVLPGGFQQFFNNNIAAKKPLQIAPLSITAIIVVNVFFGWTSYLYSAVYGVEVLWLATGLALITLSNGLLHIIIAIKLKKYNPGLITSILFFIPISIVLLLKLYSLLTRYEMIIAIGILLVVTAIIPLTITMGNIVNKK